MNIFVKTGLYVAFFSILHFGYDLSRLPWLKPFCAADESIFQHMKTAYWAFILACLIEHVALKRRKKLRRDFWTARMMSAVFVPWTAVLVWYLAPALVGRFTTLGADLTWAVLVTAVSGVVGVTLERGLERTERPLPWSMPLALFLFLLSGFLYIAFTYNLPWADMFAEPPA